MSFVSFFTAAPSWAKTPRRLRLVWAIAVLCALASILIAWFRVPVIGEDGGARLEASRLAASACEVIRNKRSELGIPMNPALDPALSGLIGEDFTDLTSTEGSLPAKRTSLNPDFAGLMVLFFEEVGVQRGDKVALSFSGSFPALNIAVLAACKSLDLKPVLISSQGASSYGANIPGLTWADMESELFRAGVFPYRSVAISLGGLTETGGGLDGTGIDLAMASIKAAGVPYLDEGTLKELGRDMRRREDMYFAGGKPAAYINVGGTPTSLGWVPEAALLDNGLLRGVPRTTSPERGLIFRMHEQGVPVIHMLNIERMAAKYGLPQSPTPVPEPGSTLGSELKRNFWGLVALLAAWALVSLVALPRK